MQVEKLTDTVEAPELPSRMPAILSILGRNTFWLWLDLGALRLGTMLAGFFLIRYLRPADFGVYSTAVALGWFANAIVDLGLTRYCARAVAANPQEAPPILALAVSATLVSVLPEIAVLLIAAGTQHWYVACLCAGLVLGNWEGTASLCSSMLSAGLRSRAILPGSIVGASGLILVVFLVTWLHLSVFEMLAALSLKSFLVFIMRVWQLRDVWPARACWRWSVFRSEIQQAWPYYKYNLTQVGYGKAPVLCLGLVGSPEKVGWFSAAFVISDIFPQWSYASSTALLPVLTRLYESKRMEQLLDLRQRLLDVLLFASVPVAVLLALFAPAICALFGEHYSSSAPVLRVVCYRCVLSVLDGFLGHGFLIAVDRVKERQQAQARSLVLLSVLGLIFSYLWGPMGAAIALSLADSSLILQYLRTLSSIRLEINWLAITPAVLAAAAMAVAGLRLPQTMNWVSKVAPALLIYLVVLSLISRRRVMEAGRTVLECCARS